jgi:hypothetical protein
MEIQQIGGCQNGVMWAHLVIGLMTGANTLLATWLSMRARKRDKKEAHRVGRVRHPNP